MEIIGKDEKSPIHGQHMATLREWGPEFEVNFQIKSRKEPDDSPRTKNVFRFTRFNSIFDNPESGSYIPVMWTQGKPDPESISIGTSLDNDLMTWEIMNGKIIVDKWYNVSMRQYMYEVNIFIMEKHFQSLDYHFQYYDSYRFYFFETFIDNRMEIRQWNKHPQQFKYVFVYFGDKYYPASTAQVRNFNACQGNHTIIIIKSDCQPMH